LPGQGKTGKRSFSISRSSAYTIFLLVSEAFERSVAARCFG
jgi:hypothetical protein